MIARLSVPVPFDIACADGAQFTTWVENVGGYEVMFRPPQRAADVPLRSDATSITVDGAPGFLANVLSLTFGRRR
jgi:hypothetical protein